jgi:hypothetical protein
MLAWPISDERWTILSKEKKKERKQNALAYYTDALCQLMNNVTRL